jgi:hypothetical protein
MTQADGRGKVIRILREEPLWNGSSVSRILSAIEDTRCIHRRSAARRVIFKLLAEEQEKFRQARETL